MNIGCQLLIIWVICIFFNLMKIYQANNVKKIEEFVYVLAIIPAPFFTLVTIFVVIFIKKWDLFN